MRAGEARAEKGRMEEKRTGMLLLQSAGASHAHKAYCLVVFLASASAPLPPMLLLLLLPRVAFFAR